MEILSTTFTPTITKPISSSPSILPYHKKIIHFSNSFIPNTKPSSNHVSHKAPLSKITAFATISGATPSTFTADCYSDNLHWVVLMDKPSKPIQSKEQILNYYVSTLQKALGSEKDAENCIYNTCFDTNYGFCCIVNEVTSRVLASQPGVISVKPSRGIDSVDNNDSSFDIQGNSVSKSTNGSTLLFPKGLKHWLVLVHRPPFEVSSKVQAVDYYVDILTKVLGNEKDAQMCLYHVAWQSNSEFCCVLDEESKQVLSALPGVLSVQPDDCFESKSKVYKGDRLSSDTSDSAQATEFSKTKLFITGLSFYTSENTLRAAFEPFGELVEVKVIMDKISKRSKGYAFVEYSTEDAASTALQEMNGEIINGWMIVVDRAKSKPRYTRSRPRLT